MLPVQKQPFATLSTDHLLFFILLLYSLALSDQQVCNNQDQSALLALASNISMSHHLPLNWSSRLSCCEWEGVGCDSNSRVTHLQLPSRGLKGVISSSIRDLAMLTHLNLSDNYLHGSLGQQISSLTNLRVIDLSSNSIHGSIPWDIGNLLYLTKLHLYANHLSGHIPPSLMSCTHLEELILRDNHLDGDISKLDFSRLVQLQKLDLHNNSLNGTLPESIYSCKSLVAIRASSNFITGHISPKVADLKSLSFISLKDNLLTNIITTLGALAKCKNLTSLFLSLNFYGESLSINKNFIGSGEFPKLKVLSLSICDFEQGPVPNWLSNLKGLRVLGLASNNLVGRVPNWLGTLPHLFSLNLYNNSLFGELPVSLCQLQALSSQKAQADPEITPFELPVFVLGGSTYIRSLAEHYRRLILSYNAFSGTIPEEIGNLQNLQDLDLNNNHFSGHIPNGMSNIKNLEILNLSTNNLIGEIPTSLTSLSFLSHFDVSYNDLEGSIPTGGQISSFEESNFEGNRALCGEPLHRPCSNPTTSEVKDVIASHKQRYRFIDGSFVGFFSGFSSMVIVVILYVWCNYMKRTQTSSRRG